MSPKLTPKKKGSASYVTTAVFLRLAKQIGALRSEISTLKRHEEKTVKKLGDLEETHLALHNIVYFLIEDLWGRGGPFWERPGKPSLGNLGSTTQLPLECGP